MTSRRTVLVGLAVAGILAFAAAGCKGTEEPTVSEQAATDAEGLLIRPRRLMPDVEPLQPTGEVGEPSAPAPEAPAEPAPGAPTAAAPAAPTPGAPAAAPALPAALPPEVAQAAKELAAKSPTIRTVAFNISGTRTTTGGGAPGAPEPPLNGRVEAIPPDRFRIEGTSEMGGQEVKMLMVMNGPKMWAEIRDAASDQVQQVIKMDLSAMAGGEAEIPSPTGSISPDAANVLANLAERVAFEAVREETLDGEACKVFEGKCSEPGAGPETVRVWIATSDGLLRRIQNADASGNVTEDVRISNMETNPPLPLSRFEYTPPPGVPVMDMVEMLKQMMEGLGEAMDAAVEEAPMDEDVPPETVEVAPADEGGGWEDEGAGMEEGPVLRDVGAGRRGE